MLYHVAEMLHHVAEMLHHVAEMLQNVGAAAKRGSCCKTCHPPPGLLHTASSTERRRTRRRGGGGGTRCNACAEKTPRACGAPEDAIASSFCRHESTEEEYVHKETEEDFPEPLDRVATRTAPGPCRLATPAR
ncbi:unnamed protein product [Lampetra fluviatilis]